MIDPKELRLGNLVYGMGNHVLEIYTSNFARDENPEFGYEYKVRPQDHKSKTIIRAYNLEPIPLTEEWLVKLGFEKCNDLWREPNLNIYLDESLSYWTGDSQYSLSIPQVYVHQLQNLYFALTGKELQINSVT